jgi:hypothetical protein
MINMTGRVATHIVPSFSKKVYHGLKLDLSSEFVQRQL